MRQPETVSIAPVLLTCVEVFIPRMSNVIRVTLSADSNIPTLFLKEWKSTFQICSLSNTTISNLYIIYTSPYSVSVNMRLMRAPMDWRNKISLNSLVQIHLELTNKANFSTARQSLYQWLHNLARAMTLHWCWRALLQRPAIAVMKDERTNNSMCTHFNINRHITTLMRGTST